MPIGSDEAYQINLNRYDNLIKPAIENLKRNGEQVYDSIRADFISSTGSINRKVLQYLYNADVVIADLTELNPNVFYELGVRHSLRNGTILLALKGTKPPFDVGDLNIIFYEDRLAGEAIAIPKIQKLLEGFIDSKTEDSPVFFVLPELKNPSARDLGEAQARISALESETGDLRTKLAVAEQVNLSLRDSFATFEQIMQSVIERSAPKEKAEADKAIKDAVREQKNSPRRFIPKTFDVEEDSQSVFVLMPFRKELEIVHAVIKRVGASLGLKVFRADEITSSGRITDQILEAIIRSGIIIADISGQNPNVLYEVGIAHSLQKETILISKRGEHIPFDIAGMRVFMYESSSTGMEMLQNALSDILKESLDIKKSRLDKNLSSKLL